MRNEEVEGRLISRNIEDSMVPSGDRVDARYLADHSDSYGYGYQEGWDEESSTGINPVFRNLIRAIKRGKWLILAMTVLATIFVGFIVYRMRPTYTASTMVEISQDGSRGFGNPSEPVDPENSVNINTKILMFSGRPLLEEVVVKLDLSHDRDFLNLSTSRSLSEIADRVLHGDSPEPPKILPPLSPIITPQTGAGTQVARKRDDVGRYIEDPKLDRAVSVLESGIKVDHLTNTQALKISFTHPNPSIAATVANGLADVFVERNRQIKIDRFTNTSTWLDNSTHELKAKVRQAEQALADYSRDHNIFTAQGTTTLISDKLLRLHEQALRAEMDLRVKQSLYEEVLRGRVTDLPEAFSDPRTIEIQKQINQLSVKAAELSVSYGPDNPNVQETQQQISKLREQMETGRNDLGTKIKSDYERAETDYKFIKSALEQAKIEAAQQDQAAIQYSILKQDVDTARSLYNEFLQKTNQANLEEAQQQQNNVDILRPARIPRQPDGPPKGVILLLGPLVGVLAGVGIAFAREHFDRTIRSSDEVAQFVQLPVLGAIPSIPSSNGRLLDKRSRKKNRQLSSITGETEKDKAAPNANCGPVGFLLYSSGSLNLSSASEIGDLTHVRAGSYSGAAEAYRSLRTSLLLSSGSCPPRTILFTSGQAGEGKTTTTINTAIAFALQGSRVLIIDADLRKSPNIDGRDIELGQGLSTYLSGEVEIDSLIQELKVKNLSLLPCGAIPPNPSELLGSEKMKSLLADLATRYDHIMIDSSPLMYVTDPVILSTKTDAVILILHSGKTTRDVIRQSRDLLTNVGAKVFGVVVNNIDLRHKSFDDLGPYGYYYRRERGSVEHKASNIVD